ncbi:hypothetical protein [Maribacter halichondriae]|uniref:hypothetical protein n=1 Tax=Maribacter halichondriae TaxID=2980554 RepID=UPI0023589B46|nr:hypothetical protein [Maribacter sp. Hal144]
MHKFIKNIILLGLLSLGICYFLDKIVTKGLRKSNMVMYDNLTQLFHGKINADLIVNGSSKAYVQVDPRILDSALNLNSFNLGLDGNNFTAQKMVFDFYKEHNKNPKIVVQVVSNGTLTTTGNNLYNHIKFAPYLNEEKIYSTTKRYDDFSILDYHIPMLKYAEYPLEVVDGFFSYFNIHFATSPLYKGYLANDIPWDGSFEKFKEANENGVRFELDKESRDLFETYIEDVIHNNTEMILIYPPVYHEFQSFVRNRDEIIAYYETISLKYDIAFFDFSQDEMALNRTYFYNSQHLNKTGAELFTKKLSEKIKTVAQNRPL